jgi:CRP-like cAMP-binding protein
MPVFGSRYSSVAQALQPCKTLVWNVPAFEKLLARYPQVYSNAQNILERQIDELARRTFEITAGKVPQRLAYGLLHLRGQIGREVNGLFELDVTQETVAQMTGMTVTTANRQLNQWEKQGLVTCFRNTIGIRDCFTLSDLCRNKEVDFLGETQPEQREGSVLQRDGSLKAHGISPERDQRTA